MISKMLLSLAKLSLLPLCLMCATCSEVKGNVIVNEIMRNPTVVDDVNGEWFELFNNGTARVNLKGWTFTDDGLDRFRIRSDLVVPSKGYAVLGTNGNINSNGGLTVDYVYSARRMRFRRNDALNVFNTRGRRVDRVNWSNGNRFSAQPGTSIALININLNNNAGINWCLSTTPYGLGDTGTPGSANDCLVTPMPPVAPSAPKAPSSPLAPVVPKVPVAPTSPVTPVSPTALVAPAAPAAPPVVPTVPMTPVAPKVPTTPLAPTAPVSPVAPSAPMTLVAPSAPMTLVATSAPISPVAPSAPISPVAPSAPITPVAPTAPINPAAPTAPMTPAAPTAPKAPAAPSLG